MPELHPLTHRALYGTFMRSAPREHSKILLKMIRNHNVGLNDILQGHPLADEWSDFAHLALRDYFAEAKGLVYLLTTPQYPETIKVGMTTQLMPDRLRQLNNESVVWYFVCAAEIACHDRRYVEGQTHQALRRQGIVNKKEFFKCSVQFAKELSQSVRDSDITLLAKKLPELSLSV